MIRTSRTAWKRGNYRPDLVRSRIRESRSEKAIDLCEELKGTCDLHEHNCPTVALVGLDDLPPNITKVVLYGRISNRREKRTIPAQQQDLIEQANQQGLRIVGKFFEIENGSSLDRSKLRKALKLAEAKGAALLAHNSSRYLRHPDFCSHEFDLQPGGHAWYELSQIAPNVPLVSIVDPTATNRQIKSEETCRGKRYAQAIAPVTWKKQRKATDEELLAVAEDYRTCKVSKNAFCESRAMSKKTLNKALDISTKQVGTNDSVGSFSQSEKAL